MRVVCDICQTEFESDNGRYKYCSSTCVYKSRIKYLKDWIKRNPAWNLFKGAKWRAKKKGLDFNISVEDIVIPDVCPILGIPLKVNQTGRPGFFNNSYSLDRINPCKGYIKDNIRVISNRANLLKSNATIEELEKILADAYRHRL